MSWYVQMLVIAIFEIFDDFYSIEYAMNARARLVYFYGMCHSLLVSTL